MNELYGLIPIVRMNFKGYQTWHLLALVASKSSKLAASYGHANIKNTLLQYCFVD